MESSVSVEAKAMSLSHSICGILGLESCEDANKNIAKHQEVTIGDGKDDSNESKCHKTTFSVK